jgi:uridylate kinase
MAVVISLGGSLIVPEGIDTAFLKQFREIILEFTKKNTVIIVCGGGKVCRNYQAAAKDVAASAKAKVSDEDLDWIGIKSTRLNAELVRAIFADAAHNEVVGNPEEKLSTKKRIIIGAGYVPGHSSDLDAVQLAENFGAGMVINMSNIDYVYDKDPRKFPDAKKIEKMPWKEFLKLTGGEWVPGKNVPFDPVASRLAMKSKINVVVLGKDLDNLSSCLKGKKFKGTVIG